MLAAIACAAPIGAAAKETVHWGIISNIVGNYVTLQDGMMVAMHHGTIIEPVGKPLYPGMRVRIKGHMNDSGVLDAYVIDKVGARH